MPTDIFPVEARISAASRVGEPKRARISTALATIAILGIASICVGAAALGWRSAAVSDDVTLMGP